MQCQDKHFSRLINILAESSGKQYASRVKRSANSVNQTIQVQNKQIVLANQESNHSIYIHIYNIYMNRYCRNTHKNGPCIFANEQYEQ